MIDSKDREILTIIQDNGRVSNSDIARQLGMAPSAILERIRKLEARGVIQGYTARVDPRSLGLGLLAFVLVRSEDRIGEEETGAALAAIPEVLEVHHVAGEDCFLVKIRAPDPEALGVLLRERFKAIPTIRSTRTTVVLNTVKETSRLPLPENQEPADVAG